MKKSLIALGLAATLSGCELLYPTAPEGAVLMDPPPAIYRPWWGEMEVCSGKNRNFSDIIWYKVPNSSTFSNCSDQERGCSGWYDSYRDIIYILEKSLEDRAVVGHESLHALGVKHSSVFESCGVHP